MVVLLAICYGGYSYYQSVTTVETTVKTAKVEYGTLKDSISATGSLSAVDNVDISSKITGRIVEVLVKENQHVEAGQVLVRLDSTSLEATARQMKARLDNALLTYNRYNALLQQGAISRSDFDLAEADYIVAQANYDQAVSNVNDTVIVSPISGYIIGEPTPVGQTISSGISEPQVIMSVANLDNMQIDTLVDLINLVSLRTGHSIGGFDADKIQGKHLELGIGKAEEPFEGIGRGILNIEGLPVYRDSFGGIGTPTSDHERTKMDVGTTHILAIVNGYNGKEGLKEAAEMIQSLLRDYAGSDGGELIYFE